MINRRHAAGFLLRHWLRQESAHSIHSPGLYRLYTEAINPRIGSIPDLEIEQLRGKLLTSHQSVPFIPIGPSPGIKANRRTVSSVAKHESAGTKAACLLRRITTHVQARRILEIGTSIGITTLYLSGDPKTEVVTIEGHPFLAEKARDHFRHFQRNNIRLIEGDSDQTLPDLLSSGFMPDFAFIDANHRFEPTCRYVEMLLTKMPDGSVLALHDIHHSEEMSNAWHTTGYMAKVSTRINLGTVGLLLTDQRFPKQELFW